MEPTAGLRNNAMKQQSDAKQRIVYAQDVNKKEFPHIRSELYIELIQVRFDWTKEQLQDVNERNRYSNIYSNSKLLSSRLTFQNL